MSRYNLRSTSRADFAYCRFSEILSALEHIFVCSKLFAFLEDYLPVEKKYLSLAPYIEKISRFPTDYIFHAG